MRSSVRILDTSRAFPRVARNQQKLNQRVSSFVVVTLQPVRVKIRVIVYGIETLLLTEQVVSEKANEHSLKEKKNQIQNV